MYLTNYTADKVKLAYTFVEHLRLNWRMLSEEKKLELVNEITSLLNVQFIEQRYESKINVSNEQADKTTRRSKLGV